MKKFPDELSTAIDQFVGAEERLAEVKTKREAFSQRAGELVKLNVNSASANRNLADAQTRYLEGEMTSAAYQELQDQHVKAVDPQAAQQIQITIENRRGALNREVSERIQDLESARRMVYLMYGRQKLAECIDGIRPALASAYRLIDHVYALNRSPAAPRDDRWFVELLLTGCSTDNNLKDEVDQIIADLPSVPAREKPSKKSKVLARFTP